VTEVTDGLGVTTAEGDVVERDGLARGAVLAFGVVLAGIVGDDGVGLAAERDGVGAALTGAEDRAGAGTTAAPGSGLNSKYAASAARKMTVTTQVLVLTRPITRSWPGLRFPARSAG
jgi:hypothetical protein